MRSKYSFHLATSETLVPISNCISRLCFAIALAFAVAASSQSALAQKDDDASKLEIGSKAPDIEIEHWVSDNDGAFEHVTKIEEDKVYVIEFWATWCGPCIGAMPHIAELQAKYEDKDVQIISISNEDLDTVEDFLERPVFGQPKDANPKKTYGDLTSTYCLTTDPDKSVMKDYFMAAGRTGIPCAFVVGKTGLVEWIGHPGSLEDVLEAVVTDKWDRDKFKTEYDESENEKMEAAEKSREMQRKLAMGLRTIQEKVADDDWQEALQLFDELIEDKELEPAKQAIVTIRLQMMIKEDFEGAPKALEEFVAENEKDAQALNEIAWAIYELYEANEGDVNSELLKHAKKAAELASIAEPESGAVLDTLAHFIYIVDEDLDKAIEVQKKAVEFAGPQLNELKAFLTQLEKEKKSGKKPKKKSSDF